MSKTTKTGLSYAALIQVAIAGVVVVAIFALGFHRALGMLFWPLVVLAFATGFARFHMYKKPTSDDD